MNIFSATVFPAVVAGVIALVGGTQLTVQDDQELNIVNQDGEKVQLRILNRQAGADQEADEKEQAAVVIAGQEGEELDLSNARSVTINKSVKTVVKDGKEERKVFGKAVIIGPDGKRHEIELGEGALPEGVEDQFLKGFQFHFPGRPGPFGHDGIFNLPGNVGFGALEGAGKGSAAVGKFMIGVNCKPVSDELRAHLDIGGGLGLIIQDNPVLGAPANKAGLKKHDILIYADQEPLDSIDTLVKAVEAAGKEKRQMNLTVLRKGKELSIDLTPGKREASNLLGGPAVVEEIGPGFVFPGMNRHADRIMKQLDADIAEQMEELDLRMKERMEQMEIMQKKILQELSKQRNGGGQDNQ